MLLVCLLVLLPQLFASGALTGLTAAAEERGICGGASLVELRELIGPEVVGECVDGKRYVQSNGDILQVTTRGLLIQKAANQWTAFTDGTSTWVHGPYGLEKRVAAAASPRGVLSSAAALDDQIQRSPARRLTEPGPVLGWRTAALATDVAIATDGVGSDTGGLGTGSSGPAVEARMSQRSSTPPDLSIAERERLARALHETHLPGPGLPIGRAVQGSRPPTIDAASTVTDDIRAAPADLTVFRSTSLGPSIAGSLRSTVDEPSASNNGQVVFYTGNWYAAVSNDSGSTFTFVDPYTGFPASFGGFCCDQLTIYDASRNITIWSLQYNRDSSGNARRIAVANGQSGVLNNTWFFWDLTAQAISFAPVSGQAGYWLDYGHIELGANYLYVSSNVFSPSGQSAGTVLFRLPLDTLASHGSLSYTYYYAAGGFSFQPVAGASNPMYFARHLDTSTLRVYQWPEGGSVLSADVPHASFVYGAGQMLCSAPDSTNACARDDSRLQAGWTWGSDLAFMWDAAQGSGGLGNFPFPYVHVTRMNAGTAALIDEPILWSAQRALMYPGAAVNAQGTVGVSVSTAGGGTFPNSVVLLRDPGSGAAWEQASVRSGTNGPGDNQWGDYLTARLASGLGPTFVGTSFTQQGPCAGGGSGCATVEPRFVWFGRQRDYPFAPQCSPRPQVQLQVTPIGGGRLQVTVSTSGTGVFLQNVQFGAANNGVIDMAGQVGVPGNFTVPLPSGTQQTTFQVQRVGPGPVTVFLTVKDSCGDWPTFVGGGPNAF